MAAPGTTVYQPSAEVYERELAPAIFRPWAEKLIDAAGLTPTDRVLDVACGTGAVARTAAARLAPDATVVGYDLNPAMLEVARRESAGLVPAIEWRAGDAAALPFPDACFDVVFCQQGAQFFTQRVAAAAEMRRVTAPGGRVTLSVWLGLEHHPQYALLNQVLQGHLDGHVLEGSDAPFSFGGNDAVRKLLRDAGFSHSHIRIVIDGVRFASAEGMLSAITGAHAPLAHALQALAPDEHAALTSELTDLMRPYADDDGVAYPMAAYLVVARP